MRRSVYFIPDEEAFVQARVQMREHSQSGNLAFASNCLFEWISMYSRGDKLESLHATFISLVLPAFEALEAEFDLFEAEQYQIALAFLSISDILEIPLDNWTFASRLIPSGNDAIIDRLLKPIIPELLAVEELIFEQPYLDLLKASKQTQPLQLRNEVMRFLRRYYSHLSQVSWYDAHLNSEAGFFGYWSFELAAFVKNYELDDRSFADNIFYPRDLVNERMYRTWLPTGYGDSQRNALDRLQKAWEKDADLQLKSIDSTFKQAQDSIRGFIEQALKQRHDGSSAQNAAEKLKRSASSLNFLSNLTGLDGNAFDKDPELAKKMILGLLQTVSKSASKLTSEGSKEDFGIDEGLAELAAAEGKTLEELAQDIPEEVREQLNRGNSDSPKEAYETRMRDFSKAIDSLVEENEIEQNELLKALEKIALEFGFSDPRPNPQEKLRAKLDEDWEKLREGKKMIDFTFDDLFNGTASTDE